MEDYKNTKTIIKRVDASPCNENVLVYVYGEISKNNASLRRFMQTFVLAPQSDSSKKYYVFSDMLKYLDSIWPVEDTKSYKQEECYEEEATLVEEPAVEIQAPEASENDSQANGSPVEEFICPRRLFIQQLIKFRQLREKQFLKETAETVTEEKSVEKYLDNIWPVEDTKISYKQEERLEEKTTLVEEPAVEIQEAAAPENVTQANGSPVEEVVRPEELLVAAECKAIFEETAESVTEEKPVEKQPEVVTSPIAQRNEEAAPVVEHSPAAKTSPVVEEPPKPVINLAVPDFTETDKSQINVVPDKISWANLVSRNTSPLSVPKPFSIKPAVS